MKIWSAILSAVLAMTLLMSGFDAEAKPYTSEQILEERARYR